MTTSQSSASSALALYQLPPFFTLQPVPATLQQQLRQWSEVLLGFSESTFVSHFSPSGSGGTTTSSSSSSQIISWCRYYDVRSPIFRNAKFNRRMSKEGIQTVLQYLVDTFPDRCFPVTGLWRGTNSAGSGTVGGGGQRVAGDLSSGSVDAVFVFASTISTVLEKTLLQWLQDQGQILSEAGAVCTMDELISDGALTSTVTSGSTILSDFINKVKNASHLSSSPSSTATAGDSGSGGATAAYVLEDVVNIVPVGNRAAMNPDQETLLRALLDQLAWNGSHAMMLEGGDGGGGDPSAPSPYVQAVLDSGAGMSDGSGSVGGGFSFSLASLKIELFNLDGSDSLPYQGVKFSAKQ